VCAVWCGVCAVWCGVCAVWWCVWRDSVLANFTCCGAVMKFLFEVVWVWWWVIAYCGRLMTCELCKCLMDVGGSGWWARGGW
jgi:hypothetical protein